MLKEIRKELTYLGFNINSRGFEYWIEAIKYVNENPINWTMMEVYEEIAKNYNYSKTCIERTMRYAIEPAKNNIQKEYNYYKKIRNKTFLNLIKIKLI